ncbi:MAG: ATP-dependent RecD-like helicase, partial [Bacillales bacterium]|nr:ATP-dependent RecD-like helicase [Bacillales bacterium]
QYIKGTHVITIFHNESNLYSVVKVLVHDSNIVETDEEITVTGNFPTIQEEEIYTFFGKMKEHPRFGMQFLVETFKREIPETKAGVVAYLSSPIFKGIGKKTAESIVETLGTGAIEKILASPSVLDTVPKLKSEKAKIIVDSLIENQGLEHVMIGLNQFGFGTQLTMKIFQVYKQGALDIITENPYRLIEDVEGIGFGKADEIAKQLGFDALHSFRVRAAIFYTLQQVCVKEGHTYLEAEQLIDAVWNMLNGGTNPHEEADFSLITAQMVELSKDSKIKVEGGRVFEPTLYFSEKGIAEKVEEILSQDIYADQFPQSEFLKELGSLEERLGISYAEAQKDAIYQALHSPMMILTGGPGTGKTTVIKGIVELFSEMHGAPIDRHAYKESDVYPYVLAAPTGRAAKRMTESTGIPAMTIHRLLGWNGQDGYSHDEDNPIEGKLVIIDESSMVDTWLMYQLLRSLPSHVQIIFVGDEDQLPSVGPGQVLKDLLASCKIPTARLKTIFRQEDGSSIIGLAHHIKNGVLPDDFRKNSKDRSFFPCHTDQVLEVVRQVAENAKKKGYSAKDIQILAPMYRGPAGIDALNGMLQGLFNPNDTKSKREIQWGNIIYRVGDKVLQLVNRPDVGVFNGDIGEIISIVYAKDNIDKVDEVYVSYDGIEVEYNRGDLIQITHAFCTSIHKSQGSEFPIVILPIVKSYMRMLRRNLIYTAVTRSKQFLILCGDEEALRYGVSRSIENERRTTLQERLNPNSSTVIREEMTDYLVTTIFDNKTENEDLTYEEKLFLVDPMIGMENITPYQIIDM